MIFSKLLASCRVLSRKGRARCLQQWGPHQSTTNSMQIVTDACSECTRQHPYQPQDDDIIHCAKLKQSQMRTPLGNRAGRRRVSKRPRCSLKSVTERAEMRPRHSEGIWVGDNRNEVQVPAC
jgi:hypothetical protein